MKEDEHSLERISRGIRSPANSCTDSSDFYRIGYRTCPRCNYYHGIHSYDKYYKCEYFHCPHCHFTKNLSED